MKRKIIAIVVVLSMSLSFASINVSANETDKLSGGDLLKQYVSESNISNEITTQAELTKQDEANINASYIQSYVDKNLSAKQSYGGCYIDDSGKLHVLMTKTTESNVIDTINAITNDSVVYETCNYTLDELIALKEYIISIILTETTDTELVKIIDDIVAVGVYEQNNSVFVEIKNCSDEKIDIFKEKISSSNLIVFENTEGYNNEDTIMIRPGSAISAENNTHGRSVGFRCWLLTSSGSYIKGFMTAAHGIDAGDDIFHEGTRIGYVQTYINGGYVDGAFVYLTNVNNYDLSNVTQYAARALSTNSYISSFATGATVYKEGRTTELTSGKITSTSVTVKGEASSVTISDCVKTDYDSGSGDSGCVVYIYKDSAYRIAGIHKGSSENNAYFVKVLRIKEAFDVVIY